jgi:hypothetical protein
MPKGNALAREHRGRQNLRPSARQWTRGALTMWPVNRQKIGNVRNKDREVATLARSHDDRTARTANRLIALGHEAHRMGSCRQGIDR